MYEIPSKFVVLFAKNRTFASYMCTMPSMRLEKGEFGFFFSSQNWSGILKSHKVHTARHTLLSDRFLTLLIAEPDWVDDDIPFDVTVFSPKAK